MFFSLIKLKYQIIMNVLFHNKIKISNSYEFPLIILKYLFLIKLKYQIIINVLFFNKIKISNYYEAISEKYFHNHDF